MNRSSTAIGVALAGTLLAACLSGALAAEQGASGWRWYASGKSIQLVAVNETADRTEFVLKNVSGKPVTALACSFGSEVGSSDHYTDWTLEEPGVLADGDTTSFTMAPEQARNAKPRGITLAAVVFADGSTEGSQTHIDAIMYARYGHILETERLGLVLQADDYLRPSGLQRLAERIGTLPRNPDEALASLRGIAVKGLSAEVVKRVHDARLLVRFTANVRSTREGALRDLARLKELPDAAAEPAAMTKARYLSQVRDKLERKRKNNRAVVEHARGLR